MNGNKDFNQIKIPFDEHEQSLLKRYIDAEKQEPDFIEKGLSNKFLNEVFFYFYYAGHGCQDLKQYIVLNETTVDKIFWPAEENIKTLLRQAGANCKALVIFDCCREDFEDLKKRVEEALNKYKFQLQVESVGGQEFRLSDKDQVKEDYTREQ